MIRVLIADDHEIVRDGVAGVVERCGDMVVCGRVGSTAEVLARAARRDFDVVVLDVQMPGHQGPETVREMLAAHPGGRVVVFSMYPEETSVAVYLRAGASSYIGKRRPPAELVRAIREAAAGRRYVPEDLAEWFLAQGLKVGDSMDPSFSPRELLVIRHLAAGLRATDIAEELGVSRSTVNSFVQRIKIKAGVRTVVEVVDVARRSGLLG